MIKLTLANTMTKRKDAPPIDPSQFVSVGEAATAVGYSERHVRILATSGAIEARKLGKWTWLINLSSLREYRRNHKDDKRSTRTRI